jgi:hypothetical protein
MARRTIKEIEYELAVAQYWLPLLAYAGYDLRQVKASDVHSLAGHIMKHPAVVRANASSDRFKVFNGGVYQTDWKALLQSLGAEERAALRGE